MKENLDRPFRTVALVARQPGLNVLTDVLLNHPRLELIAVLSHGKLPRAEGGGGRSDVALFEEACRRSNVPLSLLDYPDALDLNAHLPTGEIDLMIVLSWRYIIPANVIDRLCVGGLNIHRGALPEYAGAEPVRRAIEAGERRVAITAHRLTAEIDAGSPMSVVWLDIDPIPSGIDAFDYAEQIKKRLEPLYAPLASTAIEAMLYSEYRNVRPSGHLQIDKARSPHDGSLTVLTSS